MRPRLKRFWLTFRVACGRTFPPVALFAFFFVYYRRQGRAVKDVQSPIKIVGATKWCVFRPTEVTRPIVEEAVRERMDRMQSDRVDLLQVRYDLPDFIPSICGYSNDGRCHKICFLPTRLADALIDPHSLITSAVPLE